MSHGSTEPSSSLAKGVLAPNKMADTRASKIPGCMTGNLTLLSSVEEPAFRKQSPAAPSASLSRRNIRRPRHDHRSRTCAAAVIGPPETASAAPSCDRHALHRSPAYRPARTSFLCTWFLCTWFRPDLQCDLSSGRHLPCRAPGWFPQTQIPATGAGSCAADCPGCDDLQKVISVTCGRIDT
jgi:hypothetical protein